MIDSVIILPVIHERDSLVTFSLMILLAEAVSGISPETFTDAMSLTGYSPAMLGTPERVNTEFCGESEISAVIVLRETLSHEAPFALNESV